MKNGSVVPGIDEPKGSLRTSDSTLPAGTISLTRRWLRRPGVGCNRLDDRTTVSVRSVLVEIGQVLGSYQGKFAVIGGAVPWLLLSGADMPHIGTLDVDLTLDAETLGDGEYAQLVESLLRHGYRQREHLRRFQLVRTVPARDGGADIDVVVDFLMPRDATIARNAPPLVANFAVQRADGADESRLP